MSKYGDGHLEDQLAPGMGVLDIGANQGMLAALYAKAVGPSGYVLAVEPEPPSFASLTHGLRKLPQAHTMQAAVGATVGETVIYPDGTSTSRWASLTNQKTQSVTVAMTTVDVLAPLVPNLRGVKVDVQGGELDVLAGAVDTLRRTDVVWQIEVWPNGLLAAGGSAEALCAQLQAVGLSPLRRSWDLVRTQMALLKGTSYIDVVCRHAG